MNTKAIIAKLSDPKSLVPLLVRDTPRAKMATTPLAKEQVIEEMVSDLHFIDTYNKSQEAIANVIKGTMNIKK